MADLSLVHVQYFIVNTGFTSEATTRDYGYDLTVNTFDRDGLIEPGSILIQLKASEQLKPHADGVSYVFDLDVRDYRLWEQEPNPVFLILFDAKSRKAYWSYFQQYIKGNTAPKPKTNAKTIRIKIPMANRVRTSFFRHARRLKEQVLKKLLGADPHG
ncbi:MAG: DUF4365 domain-containing protein [Paludisphaera borealis]|uniref:DUF4365 domain-containing protein n=1 Tax=Paludisphaera borealis TaxID=1387353 RepID=UPI00284BFC0C|nr:DUF4365 domain-containing protein [Paludisphaera borealis]MDR3620371.1 DUF4365 domain-containing protein [Paludisphaera borealis]